jgi:hypothetical protein
MAAPEKEWVSEDKLFFALYYFKLNSNNTTAPHLERI